MLAATFTDDDMRSSIRTTANTLASIACASLLGVSVAAAEPTLPKFAATQLTGEKVSSEVLVGQWTLLIVTPSRDAAESTRRWVKSLREAVDTEQFLVRDVLAVDLPFFISEADAVQKAREVIPERYHDQTWLLSKPVLEKALNIPRDSERASVVVLNPAGEVVHLVHGALNEERLSAVVDALPEAT